MGSSQSQLQEPLAQEADDGEEQDESMRQAARQCCSQVMLPVLIYYAASVVFALAIAYAVHYIYFGRNHITEALPAYRYMLPYELLAAVSAVLASLNSFHHIFQHIFFNKNGWHLKRPILLVLLMVPIYAVCSCISLVGVMSRYNFSVLFNAFREAYEAFVLIAFMQFIAEFWGGTLRLACLLDTNDLILRTVYPESFIEKADSLIRCCCPNFDVGGVSAFFVIRRAPGSEYVAYTYVAELQYAAVMILYVLVNMTMWGMVMHGSMDEASMETWGQRLKFVKIASNVWAFYNLFVMFEYLCESKNTRGRMSKIRPMSKFFCVKLIVLVSLWQEQILSKIAHIGLMPTFRGVHMDWSSQEKTAEGTVNFLVCLEMILFAQWHRYAYPVTEKWGGSENATNKYKPCWFLRGGLGKMTDDVGYLIGNRVRGQQQCVKMLAEARYKNTLDTLEGPELKGKFKYFELDDNGEASLAQIRHMLVRSGLVSSMHEAFEKVHKADSDGTGRLSYEEFCTKLHAQ